VSVDWASTAAWQKRDLAFGDLRKFDDGHGIIAMEFFPGSRADLDPLREAWLAIERPCAILEAVGAEQNVLLLRYAALNWKLPPLFIDSPERVRMACAWLVDIADAYKAIAEERPHDIPWFFNARVWIDLNVRPRLAFLAKPPERHELPPEVFGKNATWDERTLVYQVGTVMKRLVQFNSREDTPFRHLVTACCHDRPWKRWKSLDDLIDAVKLLVDDVSELRTERRSQGWDLVEEGFGWLELGENTLALTAFRAAAAFSEYAEMAAAGEACVHERFAGVRPVVSVVPTDVVSGSFTARKLSDTYERPILYGSNWIRGHSKVPHKLVEEPSETLERARQAFHLGAVGHAEALAHQVRTHAALTRLATLLIAEIHLRRRQFDDALQWLDPYLKGGGDARAEYIRAKAMFAAGRLHEAHAGFNRALELAPAMIEAMLLRREVDRALLRVRAKAGDGTMQPLTVPPGLEELRDLLLSGDSRRVVAALDQAQFHADAEAQLVLAQYLAMDGQHERALEVYDRITNDAHRVTALLGKATTLLDLGRDEAALAILDQLVAERATDAEASEGRARALEKLGRIGEAAAEYRRFISLATAGSDLRVRAAQEWLDAHPL
jgi:tetratricopeptide (TPR) repeat protein